MDKVLLEKFLLEIMPDEGHPVLHELLGCIFDDPSMQFAVGYPVLAKSLQSTNKNEAAAAFNGLLLGITLSHALHTRRELQETILREYLEEVGRKRGDNVASIFMKRAEK